MEIETNIQRVFRLAEHPDEITVLLEEECLSEDKFAEIGITAGLVPSDCVMDWMAGNLPLYKTSPPYLQKLIEKLPFQSLLYTDRLYNELKESEEPLGKRIKMNLDLTRSVMTILNSTAEIGEVLKPIIESTILLHKDTPNAGSTVSTSE